LGVMPDKLSDRIQAFPIAQLETLAEDLLDFNGLDDLTDWLNRNE
jgi:hypothetical protein